MLVMLEALVVRLLIVQANTFEGLVGFFEAIGGVPDVGRRPHGPARTVPGWKVPRSIRRRSPSLGHHNVAIKACEACDAKRKGKIERPFGT